MKTKRILAFAVALAMVLSIVPAMSLTASAAEVTLVASDDSFVQVYDYGGTGPASNFNGNSNGIYISKSSWGNHRKGYAQFDLTGIDPTTVISATLAVVPRTGDTGTTSVFVLAETFDETTLTYNNSPTRTDVLLGTVKGSGSGVEKTLDVTSAIQNATSNTFGVVFGENSGTLYLHSKETDESKAPRLIIVTGATATVTWTVDGEEVASQILELDDDGVAVAPAKAYSANGSNVMYASSEQIVTGNATIALEAVANTGLYAIGEIIAKDGVQYEVKSANLIPNADFSYGLAGWYAADGNPALEANFITNAETGSVTLVNNGGSSSAYTLQRGWAVEEGKTYAFIYNHTCTSDNDRRWQRFSLNNEFKTNNDAILSGAGAGDQETGQSVVNGTNIVVFTNTEGYMYANFVTAWMGTITFSDFGLYEVQEAEVTVTEEVASVAEIAPVKVVGDVEVYLPTTVAVTGNLDSHVNAPIVWDAPASYTVGTTVVEGMAMVQFGEQEVIEQPVSIEVTVLEETFTLADTISTNGQPGNVVYFPVEISDEFTIQFNMTVNSLKDSSAQLGYNGTLFSNGALGISPNGGTLKATGGNAAGTSAGITLKTGVEVGDVYRIMVTMDPSNNTYTATAVTSDGEVLTTGEKTVRRAHEKINTITFLTNGGGADGDISITDIKVNANVTKSEFTFVTTIDGETTTTTGMFWSEAEAIASVADKEGYEKTVAVEGTTITVVYANTVVLKATFIDSDENVIKAVEEVVIKGETVTVNSEEIFFIDTNDAGHFYAIPETVVSEDNNNLVVMVSEVTNKYAVIYDAFTSSNDELWGGFDPDSSNSIFVASAGGASAPAKDANGENNFGGGHTPSTLGTSRKGYFKFPVVTLADGQKATAVFGVRSWHGNGYSNGNQMLRLSLQAIVDDSWTELENGSVYSYDDAPVLEGWSTLVFSEEAYSADTTLTFDVTEIMAAADAAGLTTITFRLNAPYGAAYIADREEAVAGGQYEGFASYLEVEDANLVKVEETGYATLTKNGSEMNGFAYVAADDDVRLVASDAVVIGTDAGYYEANKTMSIAEATTFANTVPAGLGLQMVGGAQVRIGNTELAEGEKLDAMADSGLRFLATADYSDTVVADDSVEFGIRVGAEASDNV
ncbi:MAG: DNRLRE domain-containing protein, partial [Clostridia bacterium]|nr:DNRLRE domain-containing protein [Clostridia bacterium]